MTGATSYDCSNSTRASSFTSVTVLKFNPETITDKENNYAGI
jgi:hypothetical protein